LPHAEPTKSSLVEPPTPAGRRQGSGRAGEGRTWASPRTARLATTQSRSSRPGRQPAPVLLQAHRGRGARSLRQGRRPPARNTRATCRGT
jgi:hypothetical protein